MEILKVNNRLLVASFWMEAFVIRNFSLISLCNFRLHWIFVRMYQWLVWLHELFWKFSNSGISQGTPWGILQVIFRKFQTNVEGSHSFENSICSFSKKIKLEIIQDVLSCSDWKVSLRNTINWREVFVLCGDFEHQNSKHFYMEKKPS